MKAGVIALLTDFVILMRQQNEMGVIKNNLLIHFNLRNLMGHGAGSEHWG